MKKFLTASLLALFAQGAYALQEGVEYEVMKTAIPQEYPDKVDVFEFFSYSCIHCRHFEPRLDEFRKTLPKDVNFKQIQVVWDRQDEKLADIAAAVNLSGNRDGVNEHIFKAIFSDPIEFDPTKADETVKWLNSRTDWNGKAVANFYGTKKAKELSKQYSDMTMKYGINSTPSIVVGGKYKVINQDLGPKDFKIVEALIQKVREEKGLKGGKKSSEIKKMKSWGADLALKALDM